MPTIVTKVVKPGGGGDYSTLAAFVAGEQRDLVALNQIARAEVFAGNVSGTCSISGFATDSDRLVLVEPAPGVHHNGVVNAATAFRMTANATSLIAVNCDAVIRGIELQNTSTSTTRAGDGINHQGGGLRVEECILRNTGIGNGSGVYSTSGNAAAGRACRLQSNLIVGYDTSFYMGVSTDNPGNLEAIGNTAVRSGSSGFGASVMTGGGRALLVNNAFSGWALASNAPADVTLTREANAVFASSAAATHFFNPSAGDYRPKAGGALLDAGVDATGYGATGGSINGVARPSGAGWDIGAFEHAAPSYAATLAAASRPASAALLASFIAPVYAAAFVAQSEPAAAAFEVEVLAPGGAFAARAERATARFTATFTPPLYAATLAALSEAAAASLTATYTPSYAAVLAARSRGARVRLEARYLKPPAWVACGARPYSDRRAVVRGAFRIGRPRE